MNGKSLWIPLCAALAYCTGCANPMYHLATINPVYRGQWKQDEEYLTTLHAKVEELEQVRAQAGELTPGEQQEWARVLNQQIVDEPVARLRAAMVETMTVLPPELVDEGMRTAAKDSSPLVRRAACQAWGSRDDPAAIAVLAEVLGSDTNLDVRMAAARELGRFQDPRAVQALGLALDDSDPAIQFRAMQSLQEASGEDFGNNVVAWRQYVQGGYPNVSSPSLVQRLRRWF